MTTERTPSPPPAPLGGEGVAYGGLGIARWAFTCWVPPAMADDQAELESALRVQIERNRLEAGRAGWWSSPLPGATTVELMPAWRMIRTTPGDGELVEYTDWMLAVLSRPDDPPDPSKPDALMARMEFRIVRTEGLEELAAEMAGHPSGRWTHAGAMEWLTTELATKLVEGVTACPEDPS